MLCVEEKPLHVTKDRHLDVGVCSPLVSVGAAS